MPPKTTLSGPVSGRPPGVPAPAPPDAAADMHRGQLLAAYAGKGPVEDMRFLRGAMFRQNAMTEPMAMRLRQVVRDMNPGVPLEYGAPFNRVSSAPLRVDLRTGVSPALALHELAHLPLARRHAADRALPEPDLAASETISMIPETIAGGVARAGAPSSVEYRQMLRHGPPGVEGIRTPEDMERAARSVQAWAENAHDPSSEFNRKLQAYLRVRRSQPNTGNRDALRLLHGRGFSSHVPFRTSGAPAPDAPDPVAETVRFFRELKASDPARAAEHDAAMKKALSRLLRKESESAPLDTALLPHQRRAADKAAESNLLVAHGLGTGKTLTSLEIARLLEQPATFLVPASVTGHYRKEIGKHTGGRGLESPVSVRSLPEAALRQDVAPGGTLIVDEAHTLRNPDTRKAAYVKALAERAGRLVLLSGTPAYNRPGDLAATINLLHGDSVVPSSPDDFEKVFVGSRQVKPPLLHRLRGVKPGEVKFLQKKDVLLRLLSGRVDVHGRGEENFPSRTDTEIRVPMGPVQSDAYRVVKSGLPVSIKAKIGLNLPPSKTEAKSLNSFLTGIRQASLSPGPYIDGMTPEESAAQSPKLTRAADEIAGRAESPDFRSFVYTNYMEAGAVPMQAALAARGVRSEILHGGVSRKERARMVADYNEGRLPVIIGTSAASEGIDLKGTRLVQILDPHFNQSRIEQAIGRGIRYKSHEHLPEDQREVEVQHFVAEPPRSLWQRVTGRTESGADEWLRSRSVEKQKVIDELRDIMIEASGRRKANR